MRRLMSGGLALCHAFRLVTCQPIVQPREGVAAAESVGERPERADHDLSFALAGVFGWRNLPPDALLSVAPREATFRTAAATSTMSDLRAHHFGVTVTDLDRAVEFYRDVLDLDVLDRFTVSGDEFSEAVGVANATGSFAHLDADGARVELIEYEPEGDDATGDNVNQPGAKHLGLATDDLDAFYDELPTEVETISEPRTTSSGTRILFVRDPESNLVEIVEA